ncbi:MAG: DUF4331 family protein [Gemmatimonadota bacterium]
MHWKLTRGTTALSALLVTAAIVGAVRYAHSSDHQDTPLVELNPRMDLTDFYAFQSPTNPNRIVLIMNTSGFLDPAQTPSAAFDPELLYQFKVDNTGDALEDKVIQVSFKGSTVADQKVEVRIPGQVPVVGAMHNRIADIDPALTGPIGQNLGSNTGVQVYAGAADDPFFLDLEAAFCILPDRRPSTGALSHDCAITLPANSFRPAGEAHNYIAGYNVLSIAIEMPKSMLEGAAPGKLGMWATISR